MTMQRTLKLYRLPEETKTPGFRVLEQKDIKQAYQLLNKVSRKKSNTIINIRQFTFVGLLNWSEMDFFVCEFSI